MATVQLKNGETVRIELDNLTEFLEKNRNQVVIQHKKMGKRRTQVSEPTNSR